MTAAEQRDIDAGFLPGTTTGSGPWGSPDYNWQSEDYVPAGIGPARIPKGAGGLWSQLSANAGWVIVALVVGLLLFKGRN
jgi:hypothetical protein